MTNKEEQTIKDLLQCIRDLKEENNKFREDVTNQIKAMESKVEQKELPLSLEKQTIYAVTDSLKESLKKVLCDSYNSPLKKYAENIILKYQNDIEKVFDKIISEEINQKEFYDDVKKALLSKIAKSILHGFILR